MSKRAAEDAPEVEVEVTKKPFDAEATNGNGTHAIAEDAKAADAHAEAAATAKPVLYHSKHACSTRPMVVIHELGIADKFDVKVLEMADLKKDDFLAVNPHGTVPALKTASGKLLIESGAIALHLAETYGGADHALLGTPENRAEMLQWMFYAPATLYPLMLTSYNGDDDAKEKAKTRCVTVNLPYIRDQLADKTFILGDTFTLADVYLAYELWGMRYLKWTENFPTLEAYVQRIVDRPAWATVAAL